MITALLLVVPRAAEADVPPLVRTTRVSVSSAGAQGNDISWFPSISADGRYVAFYSYATNLVPGDTNGSQDVFVHDRQTGATTRVSVSSAGVQGNGSSYLPSISADGWYVVFHSAASNLVPGDTNGTYDVFVHDRACLSITTSPASQTVCAGQPVAFSVTAEGDPPLTYQWRRNAIDIPGATGSIYAIASAAPAGAGSYDVVVTNDCGSLTSDAATLTVYPRGDMDSDSDVDFDDIIPFVLALTGAEAYYAQYPNGCWLNADCNADGNVDFDDINAFVAILSG